MFNVEAEKIPKFVLVVHRVQWRLSQSVMLASAAVVGAHVAPNKNC